MMVIIGIMIMFLGYLFLSIPLGGGSVAIAAMGAALLLVSLGTGFFKGNLQVMVGDLYNDPRFSSQRDAGFSLFYMAINIGALFAPTAATAIMAWAQGSLGYSKADSYHFAFAVACVSVIVSIIIYFLGRPTYKQVIAPATSKDKAGSKTAATQAEAHEDANDTKERIVCLCLVFAVVIFFWMAFHQNGLTLTWFADEFTATSATGVTGMEFNVLNLVWCIFMMFGICGLITSKKTTKAVVTNLALIVVPAAILVYTYMQTGSETVSIAAPIFQQFNPCFVVALTPVSIALFSWLGKKGKEPKAPVKIGLGMLVAAVAYIWLTVSCLGLPTPNQPEHVANVSPNILVRTYLILTFAELLLSPIGIAFVSKVAPAKYKGLMMGGWFVATAIGNKLVSIPGHLWDKPLPVVWGVLAVICLVAALFIFSIIKKLNKVS
jgi:proton-dependent oligopeptide transporter, POT family